MKKFVAILAAVLLAVLAIVPMAGASGTQMYVYAATGTPVAMRSTMDSSAENNVVCTLGNAKPVTVMSRSGSWAKVQATVGGKNRTGYVPTAYLTSVNPTETAQKFTEVTPFNVRVTPSHGAHGFVNLRSSDSTASSQIVKLHQGDRLTVLAESNAWYLVNTASGRTGYVVKAFTTK